MTARRPLWIALAALLAVGLACSNSTPGPDAAALQRATGLAQTAAALLTSTAQASLTPISPTPSATVTPIRIPSTATPLPPATATSAAPPPVATACTGNDSDFVSDITIPDGTHFASGTVFNKTWRLRNSGACTWTTAFQLRYATGDALGGATVNLTAPVPPGATTDITVVFTAPTATGTFTSRWQLFDDAGTAFGTKPYVQIKVP